MKKERIKKLFILLVSTLVLSNILATNLKAADTSVPLATSDIASSTVTRFPIVYGSTTGANLFDGYGRYFFQTFGNSNTVGYDDWSSGRTPNPTIYIDEDDDASTFSSTSMDYQQKGRIVKAYLYLAESHYLSGVAPTRNDTYILGPNGAKFYFDDGFNDAVYDITEFVQSQGSGTYWGKNIESERNYQAFRDNFANWEIVTIEEDVSLPYKQITVQGFNIMMQNRTLYLKASNNNFALPSAGSLGGQVMLTSAGGNAALFSGTSYINSLLDNVSINQAAIPSGVRGSDLFQGRITTDGVDVLTRNPSRIPANIDLLTQTLDDSLIDASANNLQFQITTNNDMMWLHMVGITANTGVPNINIETYIENQGNVEKKFQIGDVITISNTITPDINETRFALANALLSIQLPAHATYVPNSVNIVGNQVTSEEYDAQTGVLKFHLLNPVESQELHVTYQLQSNDGLRVDAIQTSLEGNNQVLNVLTDMDLNYLSNEVTLFPSYPVIVQHIDERTGTTLLEENLNGLYNDAFTASTATFTGLSFNPDANNSALTGVFTDQEQTIHLYYNATIYVMNFDVNKGDSANPDSQKLAFETLATKPTDPIREGYTFTSWNTQIDGNGKDWNFTTDSMPANDVTLYAQWKKNVEPIIEYTLRFELNGGDGVSPANQILSVGQKATKPTSPTRTGYTFGGWNKTKDGSGMTWNFETNIMPAQDVTLYAQWIKNDSPETKDMSNRTLFLSLCIIAGATVLIIKRSKRSYE